MKLNSILALSIFFLLLTITTGRWTEEKANTWYSQHKWGCGVNYTPAYAVNEVEFWTSFQPDKIALQLKWARDIGFSKLRVFLHIQPYLSNSTLFMFNILRFVNLARTYQHQIIFVFLDDCWKPQFHPGKQPDPTPGLHNSQWVQCPGSATPDLNKYKSYVQDIIKNLKNDPTVVMWDLYNEVGNSGHLSKSLPLTKMIFQWAREINPIQPLTSGHWNNAPQFKQINDFILGQSDVITFHAYCDKECTQNSIKSMKEHKRPVICTEYMARPLFSKFVTHLPLFKEEKVWAINWGFVFGRTQTYYPWWSKQGDPVPDVWFHDVVHPDGTPFDKNETDFIRKIAS